MPSNKKSKILIIEDSEFCAKLLKDILSKDYLVHVELTGKAGLDYANAYLPDIIILDIVMPDPDGYEVIQALKSSERTEKIPVIFISGMDDICSEEKGLSLGAADYITKPFSAPVVLLRVNNQIKIMQQSKMEHELLTNKIMLDSSPICCQLWGENIKIIDCNEAAVKLFEFEDRRDFIKNFVEKRSEAYQLDGRFSAEKVRTILKEVFSTGESITTEWTYLMPDGSQMPSEVTFVRVNCKDRCLVAAYTRDLRELVNMEHRIIFLESEAEKAYCDALTGTFNRRYLDTNLKKVIDNMSRSGNMLSLLMIDIDFFKYYNDTYGHDEGDNCLTAVAEVLMSGVKRKGDFVARYGGEEFTVVMPDTDENGAKLMAERLLLGISDRKIPHETSPISEYVTVSIGAVTSRVVYEHTAAEYIKRADKMLYISKQMGRNRITHESF